jgi:serine/threonine-protein kinase RsbW
MMASGNHALHSLAMVCIVDDAVVGKVVAATRGFGAALAPEAAARLVIIAEELVSNLVDHGGLPGGAVIEFALDLAGGRVRLTLVDPAAAFDPRNVPEAPISADFLEVPIPARGGGAGLSLVRAWAVIEGYERVGERNVLTLSLPAGLPG